MLEPKGFQVETISNGDDAMEWGRTNKPAVIILSVEPRKVGYAISNKLRRSPSLREVPLVLISSEETLATFEQHKKLKSRADEYLLKPLEESVFVSKVAGLVGIGDGDEDVHELDADSDILLSEDDEDVIVDGDDDEERTLLVGDGVPNDTSERRADTGQTPFEGEKFDPETQAAFAALEAGVGRRVVADQRHGRSAEPVVRRRFAAEPGLGGRGRTRRRRQNPAKKIRIVTARARRWVPRSSSRRPRCPRRCRCWARRSLPHWTRLSSATSRPTHPAWRCWRKVSWTSGG